MRKFAIYTYHFKDAPTMGDVFSQGTQKGNDISEAECQRSFAALFGEKNSEFSIRRINKKNVEDEYPSIVMNHSEEFVLLRTENPKQVTVWEKNISTKGSLPDINKRKIPSNPYNYVLIDFRTGHNMIAFEVDSSVWRNLDVQATLLQENVNQCLQKYNFPFAIEIFPEILVIDFVEHSRWLIKKQKIPVTKMTIYFTNGVINPKVEEIIKNDAYMKDITKRIFESETAEFTFSNPNGMRILDGRTKMLEHFVMLIGSEPNGAFRLRMTYQDGNTFVCGKDVRMEFMMNDETFFTMLGIGNLFPEHSVGAWFDDVANEIDRQKNAKTT